MYLLIFGQFPTCNQLSLPPLSLLSADIDTNLTSNPKQAAITWGVPSHPMWTGTPCSSHSSTTCLPQSPEAYPKAPCAWLGGSQAKPDCDPKQGAPPSAGPGAT